MDAFDQLLEALGLDAVGRRRWWEMSRHPELSGMTPAEVWRAGGHEAVERLVASWLEDAERVEARFWRNPALVVAFPT
jgi:hypothetical protein